MRKLIFFTLLFSALSGISQNWNPQILTQQNQGASHFFGHSVSIDGNYAVVGVPNENVQTGAAIVYKKDANGTWNEIQKITAYIGRSQDEYFGSEVLIQGNFIFVSSPTDRINEAQFQEPAGSVLIYKNDGNDNFVGIQRLRSSDIRTGDYFGYSIDAYGDYLVVGAPDEDHDANGNNVIASSGSAYVFRRDDKTDIWHEQQKLVTSHRARNDRVGNSVAIYGDYIVVGSQNNTDANNLNPIQGSGSAYVFKKDVNGVWNEMQKLKVLTNATRTSFGYNAVEIEGDFIAVGARSFRNSMNFSTGTVFMFKLDGAGVLWNEFQRLHNPANNNEIALGVNIAMKNNFLVATAPNDYVNNNGNQNNAGSAFLYQYNGSWQEVLRLETPEPELNAYFGGGFPGNNLDSNSAVSLSDSEFIIGAQLKDNNNFIDAGKAYISGEINSILAALNVAHNSIEEIQFYPNPIQETLNIQLKNHQQKITLSIYTLIGKKVFEKEIENNFSLDFNFPKGIYLAKITSENFGTKIVKLVKN